MAWLTVVALLHFFIPPILSIAAILLNGLILIALVKTRSLHTPSNALLGCLCCSDLLIGILYISRWALHASVAFGKPYLNHVESLQIIVILHLVLTGLSSLFMTLVNFDRFAAICYPYKYVQYTTLRLHAVISISIFFIYVIIMCVTFPVDMRFHSNATAVNFFIVFSITTIILIVCNWMIFKVILRHRKDIASTERSINRQHDRFQSDSNRYRIILILLIIFVVCKVPQIIIYFIAISSITEVGTSIFVLLGVSDILLLLNSFLNPLVYCFRITSFQMAVKDVLCCRTCMDTKHVWFW